MGLSPRFIPGIAMMAALVAGPACIDAGAAPASPSPADAVGLIGPDYVDGFAYYTYTAPEYQVAATVMLDGRFTVAFVSITNDGDEKFNVFPDYIKLLAVKGDVPRTHPRLSPSEYADKIRNPAIFFGALLAVSTTMVASTPQHVRASGKLISGGRAVYYVGSATITPSAQDRQAASEMGTEVGQAVVGPALQRADTADDLALRSNTLYPGQTASGIVPFRHRWYPGDELWLSVGIARETVRIPLLPRRE